MGGAVPRWALVWCCTSLAVVGWLACEASETDEPGSVGPATSSTGGSGGSAGATTMGGGGQGAEGGFAPTGGSAPQCAAPPLQAGAEAMLAQEYAQHYTAYQLGPVPGVPDNLGGCVIAFDDDDTLLIAGASETPQGAVYSIGVQRGPCGHIIGWNGTAQLVANTPYVDANLVYGPGNLMIYTQWPQFMLSQLLPGANTPARDIDLAALGVPTTGDQGPGGVGFVPPPLGAAGELRMVTWPGGRWYHVDLQPDGNLFTVPSVTETVLVPNEPGGFAYVPAGSAGFPNQSVMMAEWRTSSPADDRVAVYEVDDQGDPIVNTRKEFFTTFPRPWGAYFEPVTGDYLFLTWGTTPPDRVYIVQGFAPPPPPPQ